jgi:hypothetical protein
VYMVAGLHSVHSVHSVHGVHSVLTTSPDLTTRVVEVMNRWPAASATVAASTCAAATSRTSTCTKGAPWMVSECRLVRALIGCQDSITPGILLSVCLYLYIVNVFLQSAV